MPDALTPSSRDKSAGDESSSSPSSRLISPNMMNSMTPSKDSSSGAASDKNNSPSVLNAIEQLIEKSFDTRTRHGNNNFAANNQQSAPLGSSILKRLGIDESVDYTKPLIDTQTMNLLRGFSQHHSAGGHYGRERSASESSSVSERGAMESSMTPDRRADSVNNGSMRETPDRSHHENEDNAISMKIKNDPDDDDRSKLRGKNEQPLVLVKRELIDDEQDKRGDSDHLPLDATNERRSSFVSSPGLSSRRSTPAEDHRTPIASPISDASPRSTPSGQAEHSNRKTKNSSVGSLGALSSMFDNLTGATSNSSKSLEPGKKSSSNPLAALQKLCDKTENTPGQTRQSTSGANCQQTLAVPIQATSTANTASGAILAFSWACNDAIVTADSAIKCAFCDTPFSSKGAYRHHLSKVHFVKDDGLLDPLVAKAQKLNASRRTPPSQSHSPKSVSSTTSSSGNGVATNNRLSKSPTPPASANAGQSTSTPATSSSAPNTPQGNAAANFEESPHSKFLKYTELAKQLSSKYV